jgi:hypothetical protein
LINMGFCLMLYGTILPALLFSSEGLQTAFRMLPKSQPSDRPGLARCSALVPYFHHH